MKPPKKPRSSAAAASVAPRSSAAAASVAPRSSAAAAAKTTPAPTKTTPAPARTTPAPARTAPAAEAPEGVRTLRPGPHPELLLDDAGQAVRPPEGWALLAPGDAMLTRRVKAAGPYWQVEALWKGRRVSRGLWAPAANIERCRAQVTQQKADPRYAQRLAQQAQRRDEAQRAYVREFEAELLRTLAFPPQHAALAQRLAHAVAEHATPVGSGTVARTQRISVERRVEAALIAWMRHQTTAYDDLHIPRERGLRREVRRQLAQRSRALLDRYRRGEPPDPAQCPLARALGPE